MSNLTEDELHEMITKAVERERERCARLMELRAAITEGSAAKLRAEGTFSGSEFSLRWPFIRSVPCIGYKWERAARDLDAFAQAMHVMAKCIRLGYDPDTLLSPKKKKINCAENDPGSVGYVPHATPEQRAEYDRRAGAEL